MAAKQTERSSPVIKCLVTEKCKPCDIYRRMCIEKHVLVRKMFTNGLNMGFPQ